MKRDAVAMPGHGVGVSSPASAAGCPVCHAPATQCRRVAGRSLNGCASCGLEWFDAAAYEDDHVDQYLSNRTSPATYYSLSAACDRDAFNERMRQLIEMTGTRAGRVLDIGCTVGTFLQAAASHGWEAVGVEPNAAAAAHARAQGLTVHDGFFDLELAGRLGQFDAVHLSEVIEHVFDPVDLLRVAARTLKPGGVLIVTTPDFDTIAARTLQRKPDEHVVHFRRSSLVRAAERAGLEVAAAERLSRRRSIAAMQHSTTFGAAGRAIMRALAFVRVTRAVEWVLTPLFRDTLLLIARRPLNS